jgi:hypothetical protein
VFIFLFIKVQNAIIEKIKTVNLGIRVEVDELAGGVA